MRKPFAVALAAGLALCASGAGAQTQVNASASITVGTVLSLDVTNPTVTFSAPTVTNFDNGYVGNSSSNSVITHKGNVAHAVKVWTTASNMTASGGAGSGDDVARAAKPVGDLRWSTDGTNFTNLTTSATAAGGGTVVSAARGGSHPTQEVRYRMALSYADDTPGTYSLNFTYTIIAN